MATQAPPETAAIPHGAETSADGLELDVQGMHCSSCAVRIQRKLTRHDGVSSASVNLATNRAFVAYHPEQTTPEELCEAIESIGYHAVPHEKDSDPMAQIEESDWWGLRIGISWPLTIIAIILSFAVPPSFILGWSVLVLAFAVEGIGGWPFIRTTFKLLRHLSVNMDTLIFTGTASALVVNLLVAIALGPAHVHNQFGAQLHLLMSPVLVSIIATSRFLEARARRHAFRQMHSLLSSLPTTIHLLRKDGSRDVPLESVPVGAIVRVRPYETIPLDGTIVTGWSSLDLSMISGESLPLECGPGASVVGGTSNGEGVLDIKVSSSVDSSTISSMQRLVDEAQRSKPEIQILADRVSGVFVPVVLALAALTVIVHFLVNHQFETALLDGIAVTLVACPCAMGLAAPVAMMVATGRASSMGILVRKTAAMDRLAKVSTVVFDKTGTLTDSIAVVAAVIPTSDVPVDTILSQAAALERDVDHPIARAICRATEPSVQGTDIRMIPGQGVTGTVESRRMAVKKISVETAGGEVLPALRELLDKGCTVVALLADEETVGLIGISTRVRDTAWQAIDDLHAAGLRTAIISGDNEHAVTSAASSLDIEDVVWACTPEQKLAELDRRAAQGERVLMIGDGVNDAPALAAAHVSISMGTASQMAEDVANVSLRDNDLQGVPLVIALARKTRTIMLENFGWAFGYNLAALPLAAIGLLDPIIAAAAMGTSSLVVMANSLRLSRFAREGANSVELKRPEPGARTLVLACAVPMILFLGLTIGAQAVSPAKGVSLIPDIPTATTISVGDGWTVESYLDDQYSGANEFHLFVFNNGAIANVTAVPTVAAVLSGKSQHTLTFERFSSGHFAANCSLGVGHWKIVVNLVVHGVHRTIEFPETIS